MRRARVTRRAALTAMAGIPALAACTRIGAHAGSTGSPPAVGSMVPEARELTVDVAQVDPGGEGWRVDLSPEGVKSGQDAVFPSQAGPLAVVSPGYYNEALGNSPDSPNAALMSFDPADGSLAWARLVCLPGGAVLRQDGYPEIPWGEIRAAASRSAVAVSPDGRHVCVILRAHVSSVLSEHVSAAAVLDATSGQVVRVEEIRGFVMAQALTDDALIVQTSDIPYPAGDTVIAGPGESGAGSAGAGDGASADAGAGGGLGTGSTLTSFPLADPHSPPTTGSTPLWLLGATHGALILGAARIDPQCLEGSCLGYRAALATASGQVTGRIDGVYAVHPSGLLERFTGGEAADGVLSNTVRHAADQDGSHRGQAWIGLGRELLDPASGAAVDITGFTLSDVPTATTWVTARWKPAWSEGEKGEVLFRPEADGWMAAPGDPVSTEPIMTLDYDGAPSANSPALSVSLTRTPFTGRTA